MGVSSHFSETLDDVIYFEGLDLGLKGLLKNKKVFKNLHQVSSRFFHWDFKCPLVHVVNFLISKKKSKICLDQFSKVQKGL